MGIIEVRRPQVQGAEERLESWILSLLARRTREASQFLPRGVRPFYAKPAWPETPTTLSHRCPMGNQEENSA